MMPDVCTPFPVASKEATALDIADDCHAVCHDLSGHLATIALVLRSLGAREDLPAAVSERLARLLPEVSDAAELVRRVTTHARRVAVVDLAQALPGWVARARGMHHLPGPPQDGRTDRRSTDVRVHTGGHPVCVRGDALEVARLVTNLVDNALRAAGPQGRVVVGLRLIGAAEGGPPRAVLTVEDSGPGFGSAPAGVASLGLHVVRAVLDELRGTMVVGRSALGGACIEVTLPAAAP